MKIKPLFVFCATTLSLALLSGISFAEDSGGSTEEKPSIKELLERIRKEARSDFRRTSQLLKDIELEPMGDEDKATWVRLSREAAVRNGDRALLVKLKNRDDPFSLLPLSHLLAANGYLNEANFPAARSELAKVGKLEKINTRDQRRYWALKARLAYVEKKPREERAAIERIVHELGHWPSANCQSCHNDLKSPQTLPLLEVQNTWYGQRFVELMQKQGDATAVRRQAEKKLASAPEDKDARIFLGFALLAQGNLQEADQNWRMLPWIARQDRSGLSPRMMFAWP